MVGLAGEIGGQVIVLVLLEGTVAEVAPKNGCHPEFVGFGEGPADFNDLGDHSARNRNKWWRRRQPRPCRRLPALCRENLVELVGKGEKFVVIHLNDEGNLVGVFTRDGAENAIRRSYRVAAAFNGQFDDIFTIEIIGILREAGTRRVLDALIDGEDRKIARATEASVKKETLRLTRTRGLRSLTTVNTINKVRAGDV